ncbi:unnamed protein product [Pseudo-nitzschia multistriata]|uniref:Uncharacterized protein n=1 Tax=Pseudo-nitzschia multistriata TaxID=183589 RepID=A0A448ZAD6_9STRA|nr:unnamed protein product [Pseudo-nitzschia multistriata]
MIVFPENTDYSSPNRWSNESPSTKLYNKNPQIGGDYIQELHHRTNLVQRTPFEHGAGGFFTMEKEAPLESVHGDSPVCVKDVKRFEHEPLHYEDPCEDAGGVAIDLCLPEDDLDISRHSATDDLLLGIGLELESQDEQAQDPKLQEEPQHHSRLSKQPLAPILERRVTFAAKHVVLRLDDHDGVDDLTCGIDQRYVHQVFDAVQVWFIPHHTDYSPEEKRNIWHSAEEMSSMKEDAIRAKLTSQRSSRNNTDSKKMPTSEKCSLFSPVVGKQRSLPSIDYGFGSKLKQQETPSEDNLSSSRRCRYEEMMDAVLLEQYEQKLMCFRVYGRVEGSGILDPDRLAMVYSITGDTQKAHERAVAKAERHLRDLLDERCDDESSVSTTSTTSSSSTMENDSLASKPLKTTGSGANLKRTPSFSDKMALETSYCLDKSVSSLFEFLLTPFLEIRSGDLFLGIGEEMSI